MSFSLPLSGLWSFVLPLIPAVCFGVISACLISAGIADLRVGKIPNLLTGFAAAVAIGLNVYANGLSGGLLRVAVVIVLWLIIAPSLHRSKKHRTSGGDLKMIGVNWLVLSVFPVSLGFEIMTFWMFSLLVLAIALRPAGRNSRAGLVLALTSICSWAAGMLFISIH